MQMIDWNSNLYKSADSRTQAVFDSINTSFMRYVSTLSKRTHKYLIRKAKLELLVLMITRPYNSAHYEINEAIRRLNESWNQEDNPVIE